MTSLVAEAQAAHTCIRFLVWPKFASPGAKRLHARHDEQSENGEQGGDWEGDR